MVSNETCVLSHPIEPTRSFDFLKKAKSRAIGDIAFALYQQTVWAMISKKQCMGWGWSSLQIETFGGGHKVQYIDFLIAYVEARKD